MSSPPVIALRGVSVGYDDKPAVSDIDLTVRAGDAMALIGPNGSGKSTLVARNPFQRWTFQRRTEAN